MTRCKVKDSKYFEAYIPRYQALIQRSYGRIADDQVVHEQLKPYKGNIFTNHLHLAIALYSAGEPIVQMTKDFQQALKLMPVVWPDDGSQSEPDFLFDWYVKLLWVITLGLALEISDDDFKTIAAHWERIGRKDWLIEYLLASRIKGQAISNTLLFPQPFGVLKSAVEEVSPEKASSFVKTYLEKDWYKGHSDAYWHGYHLNRHDIFFGYWSFEAAAVVKIAGIDDSSFGENEFYPKDLMG